VNAQGEEATSNSSSEIAPQPYGVTTTPPAEARQHGVGANVFIVERAAERLSIYDLKAKALLPTKISGLGNMKHATMTFAPDLRWGFVSTRDGQLHRIDLETLSVAGTLKTSNNSIDIAMSQDGQHVAVAQYIPGGLSIVDVDTMQLVKALPVALTSKIDSRVTGVVDAAPNEFVATLMEGKQVWRVAAENGDFKIVETIELGDDIGIPYDAMITSDSRFYLVAHLGKADYSVVDLNTHPAKLRRISLDDAEIRITPQTPVKLPHMASWASAHGHVFAPVVGEKRIVVLRSTDLEYEKSIAVRGHAVYIVRRPDEREVWVSFSGEDDDAFVQVIDTESMVVKHEMKVGARIYHMDFTPRGGQALISANADNAFFVVNAATYKIEDREDLESPSGIFGSWRAFRIGL
jgi:protein NirF